MYFDTYRCTLMGAKRLLAARRTRARLGTMTTDSLTFYAHMSSPFDYTSIITVYACVLIVHKLCLMKRMPEREVQLVNVAPNFCSRLWVDINQR